jgi:uncharacterized protein (TIGR02246 family)
MRNLHKFSVSLLLAGAAITCALPGAGRQRLHAALQDPADKALAGVGKALETAFNAHDAPAMSALWTEDAVHHSTSTGTELSGRQAISDAYAKLFAEDPGCKLSIGVQSAKLDTDTTATVMGTAQVDHPGRAPTRSQFEAKLTRTGANWLLTRVDETDLPLDVASALSPLGWLAGRWVEETPNGSVVNQFRWVDGGVFLLRNYHRESKDGQRMQGTQIIGWDAEQACIRTWLFDSTGSFGEGCWQPEGTTRWLNKLAIKLADGRRASLTQILERVGEDQLTLQSIDREIDGAAQPNGPVATLTRKADRSGKNPIGTSATKEGELP